MSQLSRTDLTELLERLIYDNNNKEITAQNVRNVIKDFRDSNYNIEDDELKDFKYNSSQTLEDYLNSLIGAIPLWGSTDYFNTGSSSGNIQSYNDNGIVSSMIYSESGDTGSELTINFSQNISNRKISIQIHTDSSNMNYENDLSATVVRRIGPTQIKVGIREFASIQQKTRLEILAFKTVQ